MDVSDAIRQAKWARPFRRFHLLTKDGRRLLVTEPERLLNPPTGRQILLISENDNVIYLTPDDVAAVEAVPIEYEAADGSC
jgi:hypothetical protein